MVKVEKVKFEGWNCIRVSGGGTDVYVTVDMGPRIIGLTHNGGKNHMAVFEDTKGKVIKSDKFVAYGGHRIWHAPEDKNRTYFSDNNPCEVELFGDGCKVTAPIEKETMLRRGFDVKINDAGEVTLTHFIENCGLFDVELSIWGLSQFAVGGLLTAPISTLDTGLVANANISLWPYGKMNDRRVYWGEKFVTVKPDTLETPPFKFGMSIDEGYAAYFNHNQLFVKRMEYYFGAEYPNYSSNFESYTCKDFIEIEVLSPMLTIEPGDTETIAEQWKLYDNVTMPERNDETAIVKALDGKTQW